MTTKREGIPHSIADQAAGPRVKASEYLTSLCDFDTPLNPVLPEVAFVGRSNVGKSSLINSICRRRNLARTGSKPGRTRLFNFYSVSMLLGGGETASERELYLVDLPGYGYSRMSAKERMRWKALIRDYLCERETLKGVFLLIDCRRNLVDDDMWIAELGREGNLCVVLTKGDKLKKRELAKKRDLVARQLKFDSTRVVCASVLSPKPSQQDGLLDMLWSFADAT